MGTKVMLTLGGILFMLLGVAILVYQAGSGMQEALLFIGIGIGCFIALDWYNARQPKRSSLVIMEDEEGEGGEADAVQATEVISFGGDEEAQKGGAGGGGGGGARMNHLEQAEILFQKIVNASAEDVVASMVEKGLAEVETMGYSEKGISAFFAKLGGSLSAMAAPNYSEQSLRNRNVAVATLAKLKNAKSSS